MPIIVMTTTFIFNLKIYHCVFFITTSKTLGVHPAKCHPFACWAEALVKIARMTLTIKLDRNWSSFQLANSAPPLSVTDSAIAPSARMRFLSVLQSICLKTKLRPVLLIPDLPSTDVHLHTRWYNNSSQHTHVV